MTRFNPTTVTFTFEISVDDLTIEGNVLVSGDPQKDREAENWVREQLEAGNAWAWGAVAVTAKWDGFEGVGALGATSHEDAEAFIRDELRHVVKEAVYDLIQRAPTQKMLDYAVAELTPRSNPGEPIMLEDVESVLRDLLNSLVKRGVQSVEKQIRAE